MEAKAGKNEEEIEAQFVRHQGIISQVKHAYEEAIGQVFADLRQENYLVRQFNINVQFDCSSADLEAFAAIQAGQGDSYLATDELVNELRRQMTAILTKMNQHFFDSNDVENKLMTLEVLKEKFAPHAGKDWNVNGMSPEEVTRPLRMRFLDSSIRVMERKLEAQQKELEVCFPSYQLIEILISQINYLYFQIALAKSIANRKRFQTVQNERVKCNVKMEQQMAQYKELEPQLLQLEKSINNSFLPPDSGE
ncbi:hypothetical protein KR009_005174 [Drosophila setifemur]|nr:hypothetical protein KR009_005174 [Drosophila setifemur]